MSPSRPGVAPVALVVVLAAATSLLLGWRAAPTLATFGSLRTPTATFATDTLLPPTGLGAVGGSTVALTWVQSASTYAAGYNVLRSITSGTGYVQIGTATPRSAVSYTDSPASGTYYYVLTTFDQNWRSAQTSQVSAVVTG